MEATLSPLPDAEVRTLGHPDPLADPALSRALREKYLLWDAFLAGERRVDVLPLVLSPRLHRAAVEAAEATVAAVEATARRARKDTRTRLLGMRTLGGL